MKGPRFRQILSSLVIAALLFSAGWYARGRDPGHAGRKASRRVAAHGFRFTSPLLDVELPEGMAVNYEPIPFKHKIVSLVQQLMKNGYAREVSVYYRDLLDGPWFGINEDAVFNPASMMKAPVLIAWLKRAEKDPGALKRTFAYSGTEDRSAFQNIQPNVRIASGRKYTVDELLRFMMNYSDNNATALLYNALPADELNAVLDGMDVENNVIDGENAITVHGYSGFFRVLYNAAYLNREMSEKALELLSLQDFPRGIAAGVPPGTKVSAKFGESAQEDHGRVKQLHEFGIVYHPARPYILGIMTRGGDFAKQTEVLAAVSRLVYTEVDSAAGIK